MRDDLPPWYRPSWMGFGGRFNNLSLAGRRDWTVVAAGPGGGTVFPMSAITVQPSGFSQVHHVNALDPGTTNYLRARSDPGHLIPARGF